MAGGGVLVLSKEKGVGFLGKGKTFTAIFVADCHSIFLAPKAFLLLLIRTDSCVVCVPTEATVRCFMAMLSYVV